MLLKLQQIAPLIKLSWNAATTPAIFSPLEGDIGFTYLVMPVQIRSEN